MSKINNDYYDYTTHQIKVYENKCLELKEEFNYNTLKADYDELVELLELFIRNGLSDRVKELKQKKKEYQKVYSPLLKESKRVLVNTQKRLVYNKNKM